MPQSPALHPTAAKIVVLRLSHHLAARHPARAARAAATAAASAASAVTAATAATPGHQRQLQRLIRAGVPSKRSKHRAGPSGPPGGPAGGPARDPPPRPFRTRTSESGVAVGVTRVTSSSSAGSDAGSAEDSAADSPESSVLASREHLSRASTYLESDFEDAPDEELCSPRSLALGQAVSSASGGV